MFPPVSLQGFHPFRTSPKKWKLSDRNHWKLCSEISGNLFPKRLATLLRNTHKERAGLALHFVRAGHLRSDDKAGGKPNDRKTLLTGPDATGGVREFGVRIAGTWEAQVARLLAA